MNLPTDAILADAAAIDVPHTGPLGALQRLLNTLNTILAVFSAVAIGLAGIILTWEVFGRHIWGFPSDWQDEVSVFLLIGATFGSAAWTQARRGHVGIEALGAILPPGLDRARRLLADLCACLFCGFFTWKTCQLLAEAIEEGTTSPSSWAPPLWLPYSAMAAGMALLTVQLAVQVLGAPSIWKSSSLKHPALKHGA